jgi:hypothetical protein
MALKNFRTFALKPYRALNPKGPKICNSEVFDWLSKSMKPAIGLEFSRSGRAGEQLGAFCQNRLWSYRTGGLKALQAQRDSDCIS